MRLSGVATVRVRTSLAAVAVLAVALAVTGAVLVVLLQRSLRAGVDASARLQAQAVVTAATGGKLVTSFPAAGNDTAFVQVVDQTGRLMAASSNVADEGVLVHRPATASIQVVTAHALPIGDQGTFRVAMQQFSSTTAAGALTVYAGIALGPSERSVRAVVAGLAVGFPLVLLVVALMAWWLAGRALAPVEAIRAEVADIADHRDLGRRVPEPQGDDELGRLARTMNHMLGRLEEGAVKQRRFVADASHELRSPVASARAQLEVDLAHPSQADWETTSTGVLADLDRIEDLVTDLLALARADAAGDGTRPRQPVELGVLVRQEVARLVNSSAGGAPAPVIDLDGVQAVAVLADPESLRRVVDNLLANALRHASARVVITARPAGPMVELVVADDGPGIPLAERERIFERFARLDTARSRDGGGAGLGLAIARAGAEADGGTVQVEDNQPGARFVVRLPSI